MTSLYDLTPGTRVLIQSGHRAGQCGVVIEIAESRLNGHDVAVRLDDARAQDAGGSEWPLCFYAHELAVEK